MNNFNIVPGELYQSVKELQEKGHVFQYYTDESYDGRKLTVREREVIHFANCSYLGLEKHPLLIEGAIEAAKIYGTQNSMSRAMLSSPLYKEFEQNLTKIFPGFQVVYPSTTLAHCSALPVIIGEKDAVILDAYVHNSIRMAVQLCKANGTFVLLSKHNDMDHVKYLIYRLRKEGYKKIWYMADGVYSIHGNFCDVRGLHRLLDEEEDFYAYVDDAHGIGWSGRHGCGYVIGSFGLHSKMIVAASFNKSFAGAGGGLIVPDSETAEILRYTGQIMIFSGPVQPPMTGVLVASSKLHLSDELPLLQDQLRTLIVYFRKKADESGLPVLTKYLTPIQLIRIGSMENLKKVQDHLISKGFLCTTAGYPAISKGDEGIRISLTRALTTDDIDRFLTCLKDFLISEKIVIKNV
jgi:7-keto-8-aminopelargonate synthetase-like enzyme